MLKYGISNIRRLEKVNPIPLKPITLLVGRNSGGKSTFLRTFPLFRQSLMTRTSSPILWYGDLVDFGSFDTALSRDSNTKAIHFSFAIDDLTFEDRPVYLGEHYGYYRKSELTRVRGISYDVGIDRRGERNRISSISINVERPNIRVLLEADENSSVSKLLINDEDVLAAIAPLRFSISSGSLFPELRFVRPKDDPSRDPWLVNPYAAATLPSLTKILRRVIDTRTKDKSIAEIAGRLIASGFSDPERFKSVGRNHGVTVGRLFDTIATQEDKRQYKQISMLLDSAALPSLFRAIAQHLKQVLSSTLYIGPARARSERYYRYQDLAVSEIDPDGKNFPMFLNSLSRSQIDSFSRWVKSLFGYGVAVSRQTGHISINLTDGNVETNIVDVGYGVSQILPVLGQIWWARNRPSTRESRTPLALLAIEQPELHLHPAHQALLADALVGETIAPSDARAAVGKMHYIVETHSETLINRLGEFIAVGKLDAADVQVILFEPDDDRGTTSVRTVEFNSDGTLVDWPYGFFQPAVF
jgi:predicted ATPase